MTPLAYDVIVIGAGIVGAACADECARRGMRVALIDRERVGGGATAAGMGHLVVMDDSEALFALTRYSQSLWQQLRSDLPAEVEYEQALGLRREGQLENHRACGLGGPGSRNSPFLS
jgi:glycine/D-amino acid oxidase-like deaminating enzyme